MRYVQHKNDAQGPRYRLVENSWNSEISLGTMLPNSWEVYNEDSFRSNLFLPRAEYILCKTPVVWKDVTTECQVGPDLPSGCMFLRHQEGSFSSRVAMIDNDYRLRKERVLIGGKESPNSYWRVVFIVEQKQ